MPEKRSVEQVCADLAKHKDLVASCNGYVQAVVAAVYGNSKPVDGRADDIRRRFDKKDGTALPFHYIGKDPALATKLAAEGKLVIGGLTKDEMTYKDKGGHQHTASMGHIVVVVPGGPSQPGQIVLANGKTQSVRGGYPYCYQGAAMSAYRFSTRTQVDAVFPSVKLADVIYAYIE